MSNERALGRLLERPPGDPDRIAAASPCLGKHDGHARQELRHRCRVLRVRRNARTDRHRQAFRVAEGDALDPKLPSHVLDGRHQVGAGGPGSDDQELVGTVPSVGDPGGQALGEMPGEEPEDEVPRFVPVRVIEQLEVVDVDQGHADRGRLGPDVLDRERQLPDQGAVIEGPGQRIASR